MASMGKIAQQAAERLRKLKAGDDGTRGTAGQAVTRMPAPPKSPREAVSASDAKNVQIRQEYEKIPEAQVTRPGLARKSVAKPTKGPVRR